MKRPILLRMLPEPLRTATFYRYFRANQHSYAALFASADLTYARGSHMYDLLPGDVISGCIALTGAYEPALSKRIASLAGNGGLFVDVGANMGYFSILWAAARRDNTVVAVEASPRNVALMKRNLEGNGRAEQIEVLAMAAGNEKGTVAFDLGHIEQSGWGGITSTETSTSIKVPMDRLDHLLSAESIAVLKIDVEGADTLVLEGCRQLLEGKRIQHIFFEQNSTRMAALSIPLGRARELLADTGYECIPFNRDHTEWYARPRLR